ncbi:MAG: single-stranded-DNA-specific exonuclease RecJ [Planctomycetales bacterium]|nr:single-stranded-DNA-specific exonuclease RecJ [Planctomycetales bacterium]
MEKRWRIQPHDVGRIQDLQRRANISPVIAQLLIARGIYDPAEVKQFLEAKLSNLREPQLLPGLEAAVERIHPAIVDKRRIVIYGDYDADGMTGASILLLCLKLLGANVACHIPNRLDEGYGLHADSLRSLAERGSQLVISVDCGIGSVQEAEVARELGLELIVTDHHEMGDQLPAAAAIVHPRLPGHAYPFGGLCGAGVALKLAWGLCQRASDAQKVSPRLRDFLMQAVGLAAIGTVADVVPLLDENRVLVRHGLWSVLKKPTPGLAELLKLTELDKKSELGSDDIAFMLAPRLNAAGRLGQAALGVELLTTESPERAKALAEYLHELNGNRDSLERSILQQANKMVNEEYDPEQNPALVLAGRGWHPGVIGLVASRLAEKHNLPTVVIALDNAGAKPGAGSARSACGLKLHEALRACTDRLLTHGGHAAAAGLTIDESQIEAFREEFCEYAAAEIPPENRIPEVRIDAEAALSQLSIPLIKQINQLGPFGMRNPRPTLLATGVRLASPPKKMGGGERHLSVRLLQNDRILRGIAFGQAEWAEPMEAVDGPLDIAYRPLINEYRGMLSVEVRVVDWRPSEPSSLAAPLSGPTASTRQRACKETRSVSEG